MKTLRAIHATGIDPVISPKSLRKASRTPHHRLPDHNTGEQRAAQLRMLNSTSRITA
jgi:hypothetical protein